MAAPAKQAKTTKRASKKVPGVKGVTNSFMYFCNEQRPVVKSENPSMQAKEIVQELGRRWREIGADEKARFKTMEEKDRERYNADVARVPPSDPEDEDKADADSPKPAKKTAKKAAEKKVAEKKAPAKKAPAKKSKKDESEEEEEVDEDEDEDEEEPEEEEEEGSAEE